MRATTHSIERTSPMGEKFIGTCVLCGTAGLTIGQAREACANPRNVSQEQSIMDAIEGNQTFSIENS